MRIKLYSTLLVLFLTASLSAQKLSRTEKKIVSSVEKNNKEAIGFLEKVVNINSGTLNAKGVEKVGMVFKDAFDDIGFETNWIEMPAEMNRSGHLFAETTGSKGKKLLLIGHLDTVFEEDSPFQTFEMVNDSIAHAPGGNDMKGGDVIVLYALKRSDIALGFETSTGFNYATVARRGASGWAVEVEGKRAHSSGIFSEGTGAGAIFEISRILHEFYTDVKGEDLLTFNPGVLLGGTFVNYDELTSKGDAFGKTNVVAQKAVVKGGLRFISEEQKERARAKMRDIVSNNLPKTSATVSFTDSYPAMQPTEGNLELLSTLNEVSLDLEQGEVLAYDPGRRGAADVSFVAEYVDGLDGLGTMGSNAHTPQETVNLNTIEELTKRTAILIYRLINTK